jgi:DnaJ-class molecular chaperone
MEWRCGYDACPKCDGEGVIVKNVRITGSGWNMTHTHENHPCTKCEGTGMVKS